MSRCPENTMQSSMRVNPPSAMPASAGWSWRTSGSPARTKRLIRAFIRISPRLYRPRCFGPDSCCEIRFSLTSPRVPQQPALTGAHAGIRPQLSPGIHTLVLRDGEGTGLEWLCPPIPKLVVTASARPQTADNSKITCFPNPCRAPTWAFNCYQLHGLFRLGFLNARGRLPALHRPVSRSPSVARSSSSSNEAWVVPQDTYRGLGRVDLRPTAALRLAPFLGFPFA